MVLCVHPTNHGILCLESLGCVSLAGLESLWCSLPAVGEGGVRQTSTLSADAVLLTLTALDLATVLEDGVTGRGAEQVGGPLMFFETF